MSASKTETGPTFGFVSITELPGNTWVGGYLLLNALGRPLEFHCSEPVRPNRAQQILFGETLKPFLYGEQIGLALVENGQATPQVLFVDSWHVMSVRTRVNCPTLGVVRDRSAELPETFHGFSLGRNTLYVAQTQTADRDHVIEQYGGLLATWDVTEPFQRIVDAVAELQKAA